MTSSDTHPTPRPTVHPQRLFGGEDTRRMPADDNDRTRPYVRRDALPDTPPDPEPADELGFDRPLFPPPLPGLNPVVPLPSLPDSTREPMDFGRYDRLAATRRERPRDAPRLRLDPEQSSFSSGPSPAFAPGDCGPEPVISDPWPLAQPTHPMEATQRPGISPPSVAAGIFPGRRRGTRLMVATVILAIAIAIAIGVLAGYLLRAVTAHGAAEPRSIVEQATQHVTAPHITPPPRRSTARLRLRQAPIRTPAPAIQQALARRQWQQAQHLLQALPRRTRYQLQAMVWQAVVWHEIGRLGEARYALQQVLKDPRLADESLRLEATLRLSVVLLQGKRRSPALRRAREALVLAHQQGSDELVARAEQQIARCVIAMQKQEAQ